MSNMITNLLTIGFLLVGLFFMFVGALGVYRMPDVYGRLHANTKSITLGLIGLLIAVMIYLAPRENVELTSLITRAILIILFQFVAAPVGAHILARAAHLDRAPITDETLADELADDSK